MNTIEMSEACFGSIFESAGIGIGIVDQMGRVVKINPAFQELLGYTGEELCRMTFSEFTHPDDVATDLALYRELNAGKRNRYEIEKRYIRKDGRTVWGHLSVSLIHAPPGQSQLAMGVVLDITKRKRVEEESRKQREILQNIFDHIPVMINFIGEDGRFKLVNREWERTLGWSLEEIERQNLDIFAECYPDPRERQRVLDFVAAAKNEWGDFQPRVRSGKVIDTIWAVTRLSDGTSIGIGTDLTERKRAESTLQQTKEQLQTLSRRLLELQEVERRHIARELHDEIGQILTALKINLQAVQRSPEMGASAPRLLDSIDLVDRSLRQVRNLSLDLRPSMLDDLGLQAALRWYLDQQAQRTGLRIQFLAGLPDSRLDHALEITCFRITQEAVTNIVRHARAQSAWVELSEEAGSLRLTVRDDGAGFDPATARREVVRGASLGLLGMEERVSLIGGQFEINSAPNRGTIIQARFPLNREIPGPP